MKLGIVLIATKAYFILGVRFIKRFMHFYKGNENITFYFFSDTDPTDYLPGNINCKFTYVTNETWTDGTNLKFVSILTLKNCISDYLFYFDADTNIIKDFTEKWFLDLPCSKEKLYKSNMIGGQHYGDQDWMKKKKDYDRNPLSKAYIPFDTPLPQMYYYGAFFGGTKNNMVKFCELMRSNQLGDKKIPYEPVWNDESYINQYFHYHPPVVVPSKNFEFVISDKGRLGTTGFMNQNTDNLKNEIKNLKNTVFDVQYGKVVY